MADFGLHAGLVVGPRVAPVSSRMLVALDGIAVSLAAGGERVAAGEGRAVLGGPANVLAALRGPLAERVAGYGVAGREGVAGERDDVGTAGGGASEGGQGYLVSTGTLTPLVEARIGNHLRGRSRSAAVVFHSHWCDPGTRRLAGVVAALVVVALATLACQTGTPAPASAPGAAAGGELAAGTEPTGEPEPTDEAEAPARPSKADEPNTTDGIYTEAQAARGRGVFEEICVECHVPADWTEPPRFWSGGRRLRSFACGTGSTRGCRTGIRAA